MSLIDSHLVADLILVSPIFREEIRAQADRIDR